MRWLLLGAALLLACGTTEEDTLLGGSVSRVHALDYQAVRAAFLSGHSQFNMLMEERCPLKSSSAWRI